MALRLALVLDGNAQGARSALQQTAGDVDRLTAATNAQTQAAQANIAANARAATSNANVANIAAQFQDIGVTAAMGMSPLQIALQQGTQLSAVLGSQGAGGAVRALGAAFASVLNPVSLVTIAVVGLGAAALQTLGSIMSGTDKATMSLEEHDKWLKEILTGYDAAAKAAKAASEEAQKLPVGSVKSDLNAQLAKDTAAYEESVKAVTAANVERQLSELDLYETASSKLSPQIVKQRQELLEMAGAVASGNPQLNTMHEQLTALKNTAADEVIADVAAQMLVLVQQARDAAAQVDATTAALSALSANAQIVIDIGVRTDAATSAIDKLKSLAPDLRDGYQKARDVLNEGLGTSPDGVLGLAIQNQYDQTIAALDAQKAQQAAKKAASAGNKVSDYERELTASREKTAATQLEIQMVGQSAFAAERARKILELETAAKKDAIGLSPARIAAIQAEADASAQAAAELENTKGVWSEVQQAGQSAMNSILDSVLSGGKNIGDVLKNIAEQYLKLVIQMSVTNPLQNALLGTSSPTFGSGIASFITGLFTKREFGGPVSAGQAYIVGERRPEIFVPTSSGTIIPNTSVMGGAGGGGMRFSQTIINNSQERVSSRQKQRADGSVYQELVIGATQRGMEKGQYRGFGIQSPTKSR